MKLADYNLLSTRDKLAHLHKCDGKHESLEELFECDVCDTLLQVMDTREELKEQA